MWWALCLKKALSHIARGENFGLYKSSTNVICTVISPGKLKMCSKKDFVVENVIFMNHALVLRDKR